MVFPPDFPLFGMFGCHVSWPNTGENFFVWLSPEIVRCIFSSKDASDVGSDSSAH